jgi:hypothetical protein
MLKNNGIHEPTLFTQSQMQFHLTAAHHIPTRDHQWCCHGYTVEGSSVGRMQIFQPPLPVMV